jgi:tetratricopeptide (TPR) repeat protein
MTVQTFLLTCLFSLGLVGPLFCFSGEGSREYHTAMAYLYFESKAGNYLKNRGYEEAKAMSRRERLEKALEHFENALRERPNDSEEKRLNESMMRTCNSLSIEYADANNLEMALETAGKAVELSPEDAVLWLNLANYQTSLGQLSKACDSYETGIEAATDPSIKERLRNELVSLYLKRSISENKDIVNEALRHIEDGLYDERDNTHLLSQKAEACYTLSRWDEAIDTWDYIKKLRNLNSREQTLFDEAKKRQQSILKQGEIIEERQGFVISFDPEFNRSVCDNISNFLVEAKENLSPKFDVNTDTRINVFVHTAEQYTQIHGNKPIAGTAMLNRIDIRIAKSFDLQTLKNTIYHEFTHFLVYVLSKSKSVPVWFNEGVAQYFEPDKREKERLAEGIRFYKKKKLLTESDIQNIQSLDRESFFDAYTQSLFMVKYLMEVNGAQRLLNMVKKVGEGILFEEAFSDLTGERQTTFFENYAPLFRKQLQTMRQKLINSKEIDRESK